jgi:hypothetical protein
MIPGPLERKVPKYKQKYADVFYLAGPELGGDGEIHILCRPLSLSEATYFQEVSTRDPECARDFVIKISFLAAYKDSVKEFIDLEDLPLGLFDDIADIVLEGSGFGSPDHLIQHINYYRSLVSQPTFQAVAFICKAFNGYTPREVESMSLHELAKNITLAELIHQTPFNIMTQEQIAQANAQQESDVMNKIKKEAKQNDKINRRFINFGQDNAELNRSLG